jgi:hypothetical protein
MGRGELPAGVAAKEFRRLTRDAVHACQNCAKSVSWDSRDRSRAQDFFYF